MAEDVSRKLGNKGEVSLFKYRDKSAALIDLDFGDSSGWGLCVELADALFLALSYGPAGKSDLDIFHMSALDSIAPSKAEKNYPGPIMEYAFPRGEAKQTSLGLDGLSAAIRENDAEAAQVLVDREFALLERYRFSENWREAWIRFYRAIYRDSWDRIADAVFQLERRWALAIADANTDAVARNGTEDRALAEKALGWVQGFSYERNLSGSDFVNLVSAVTEGRGDCDSRAMLWAQILAQANIPAAIMVSREHSHAMGLADLAGSGARFEADGTQWLVAETTAAVDLGLISQEQSEIEAWLGVTFE